MKNIGSYESSMKATDKHFKEKLKEMKIMLKILNLIENKTIMSKNVNDKIKCLW